MDNRNVLIVGQPGAGKTTLARYLLARTPRALIIDVKGDIDPQRPGILSFDLQQTIQYMMECREEDWHVVYRPLDPDPAIIQQESGLLCRFVEAMQDPRNGYDVPPIALCVDEAWMYGNTQDMEPHLSRLYSMGRAWRINIITALQVDTDIHRVVRHTSHIMVGMRQYKLTGDGKKWWNVEETTQLEKLIPGTIPIEGKHYIVYPHETDLLKEWDEANNG